MPKSSPSTSAGPNPLDDIYEAERKAERDRKLERAKADRAKILERLEDENEDQLAALLRKCGQPLDLVCTSCGYHHHVETKCKQKWCPVCVRAIATKRSLKFSKAASMMDWPLHLTLTVQNITNEDQQFVRRLRRAFGKLRHRKIWKTNVRGGVAGIEVTNKGKGWHPHIHALIDCRWLAIKTTRPQQGESRATTKSKCTAAKREFTTLWKTIIKEKHGVCWIRRIGSDGGADCAREVLKYAIKGGELATAKGKIGPLIHQLRQCRLTTSFGTMFGKLLVRDLDAKRPAICDGCGKQTEMLPDFLADNLIRKAA